MLVTHPAYWGRGYGKALVQWGLDFAQIHNVGQGVIGPDMGMKVYLKAGFELKTELEWEGDEITPQGLRIGVAVWRPRSVESGATTGG
jgi:GNAT superfamily N-acetyltransferase